MKKKLIALFVVLTMCVAAFAGCGSSGSDSSSEATKSEGTIMFCGSTSLYPIMSSLASSFTDEYETWNNVDAALPEANISIYVAPGGSGVGVSAVEEGTADFGMVAREVKDEEKEALGDGYQEFVVARDALTVAVNAENPIAAKIDNLDSDTIRKIFAGEITKWNEVDESLPDAAINVYIRDLSGGAYEVFQKAIMGDSEITASATQSASMTELATNVEAIQQLELKMVDAVFLDSVVADYEITSTGKSFEVLADGLSEEQYAIGFKLGANELCKKIEDTLKEMKKDGKVEEISKKWFGSDVTTIK